MTSSYIDNYTRGYIRISGINGVDVLSNVARRIMEQASDFEDADIGIVTRADVLQESPQNPESSRYLIAPFVAYRGDGDVNHIVTAVTQEVRGLAPFADISHSTVQEYHGDPTDQIHNHLGREERHQPGNPHGNAWG
jgi:hypothetical protein